MATFPFVCNIQLVGQVLGQDTWTRFVYFAESTDNGVSSATAAQQFYDTCWDGQLETVLSDEFRLVEIRCNIAQAPPGTSKPLYVLPVNEVGTVTATECLPPYATVVIRKIPDNLSVVGTNDTNYEFKSGRFSFSGIPEEQQDNGRLTTAATTAWNTVAETFEELTLPNGNGGHTVTLGMFAVKSTDPYNAYNCFVAEVDASWKLGTQNTRKF